MEHEQLGQDDDGVPSVRSAARAAIEREWGAHPMWPGWPVLDSKTTPRAQLEYLFLRFGRNECPSQLFDWWYSGMLTVDDLRALLPQAWSSAEFPQHHLGVAQWVELFRTAGFVSDLGRLAPTESMHVFRGTTWGRRRGMAWTRDVEKARWFAQRFVAIGAPAHVFECVVEPIAVLAIIDDPDGRNEAEVVVDPRLLPPLRRTAILDGFP